MDFDFHLGSDIGRKRSQNQDRCGAHPDLGLFLVADGMGGHLGGETASAMASEIVPQCFRTAHARPDEHPYVSPERLLSVSFRAANRAIRRRAMRDPTLHGMGTTLTALYFHGHRLTIGHVGDSRCYYCTPEGVWQLTRDHSLVEEKMRAGLITREEMKTDEMKNVITRSVGFEPNLNVDTYEMRTSPNDLFLICSDGMSNFIDGEDLWRFLDELGAFSTPTNLSKATLGLIQLANQRGGDDNITVVLARPRI